MMCHLKGRANEALIDESLLYDHLPDSRGDYG
jgi:hypothetical protein